MQNLRVERPLIKLGYKFFTNPDMGRLINTKSHTTSLEDKKFHHFSLVLHNHVYETLACDEHWHASAVISIMNIFYCNCPNFMHQDDNLELQTARVTTPLEVS